MGYGTTSAVVYSAPPAPQYEEVSVRPGFVYVHGRWGWQNGNWTWMPGHYERERAGYAWTEGRWEQQGNSWHYTEGTWSVSSTPAVDTSTAQGGVVVTSGGPGPGYPGGGTTVVTTGTAQGGVVVSGPGGTVAVSAFPTAAPPPVRVENYGAPRTGFVWIQGRWDWQNGNWMWVDGHWERERANQMWINGSWQMQGNRWVWVEGRWDVRGGYNPRDHR
jgi:hypothetical protein